MPDGGSDCCGTCVFNKYYAGYFAETPREERVYHGECRLRGIRAETPFWTYCDFWNGGWEFQREARQIRDAGQGKVPVDEERVNELIARILNKLSEERKSFGPVYGSGRFEKGYTRIPWDGPNEVLSGSSWTEPRICELCGTESEDFLTVRPRDLDRELNFDTNKCYLEWWRTRHPEPDPPRHL